MTLCFLSRPGIVSALGRGSETTLQRLLSRDTSSMVLESGRGYGPQSRVGRVIGDLPKIENPSEDSRNNRLLLAAVEMISGAIAAAINRYGPARVGVIVGTSTSGMEEAEAAFVSDGGEGRVISGFPYSLMEIGAPAPFLARHLGIEGPAYTVSTACTSGAKAIAAARNLLRMNICDAVITGGVDALCGVTLGGFAALEATSQAICNPLSRNRKGINLGEGAAVFVLSKDEQPVMLLGVGESSDAHHISAPDPEGIGAELAMRYCLKDARLDASAVGYLNLHATATPKNDAMESCAVDRVFAFGTPVSGTKPLTGHALGAAGALEAAFCWLILVDGKNRLPPHTWDGELDPKLPRLAVVEDGEVFKKETGRVCMSNSFAFGGNNISLAFGDAR